jgi:chemotaxis protein methyltransferase CheR
MGGTNDRDLQPELNDAQFAYISRLVYRMTGINLQPGKEVLVQARLAKRLRHLRMDSFAQYLEFVKQRGSAHELGAMIDVLTTNKTSFFREPVHFEYMRAHILPPLRSSGRRVRFWSAGCSSGEEPYSIAMILREEVPDIDHRDYRILATDISARVVARAQEGEYEGEHLENVPPALLRKHFTRCRKEPRPAYRVNDNIKALVRFARLNLMEPWPMNGPFDVIFCRNVMIYFDKPTQKALARRFWELLKPEGHLLIGHSESLSTSFLELRYVQPAVYIK